MANNLTIDDDLIEEALKAGSHKTKREAVTTALNPAISGKVQSDGGNKYAPDIVLDPGGKVHKTFHITGIPRSFLFGRDGKLLAVAIDQRSRRQFLEMLSKTDLHQ